MVQVVIKNKKLKKKKSSQEATQRPSRTTKLLEAGMDKRISNSWKVPSS